MENLLNLSESMDQSFYEEDFKAFSDKLKHVQKLVEQFNFKMVDKTLCSEDLVLMSNEMKELTEIEQVMTTEKFKSNFVPYKSMYLKMVQESYRICNWVMEKEFDAIDSVFDINTFVEKIIGACEGKDLFIEMNTLFKGVFKNTNNFNLHFYGNIQSNESNDLSVLTQNKKEYRKSQKRQLEELVVPDEALNEVGDNELQQSLNRVRSCLKRALAKNGGQPISFHKFAVDPFSLTYTVENIFNLASLVKDGVVEIKTEKNDDNEFTTINLNKKKNRDQDNDKDNVLHSFFQMNKEKYEFYLQKYKITERMIDQDE